MAVALAVAGLLSGCGLKGPLYLPDRPDDVTVRPAPVAASTTTTGTQNPPATEAPPEPPAEGTGTNRE
jgi:predicted small lipoprotein YifL